MTRTKEDWRKTRRLRTQRCKKERRLFRQLADKHCPDCGKHMEQFGVFRNRPKLVERRGEEVLICGGCRQKQEVC